MLGVVLDATLQLRSVPSPYVRTTRMPVAGVDELLAKMKDVEQTADAAVVWVDVYAKGDQLGRSVIHATNWIESDLDADQRKQAVADGIERLGKHRSFGLALHAVFGPFLSLMLQAQRPMLRFFNWLYFTKSKWASRKGPDQCEELFLRFNFEASFTVPPAHLVCGPRGYTIQLTFPREGAAEAMRELIGICQTSPCPPVTTILRAHKADDAYVSFSEDGYSLNFEIHPKKRHEKTAREVADRLIDAVAKRGGKIHLAKDQVLTPAQYRKLYPGYAKLNALKARLDPEGLFLSDLTRRVDAFGTEPGA